MEGRQRERDRNHPAIPRFKWNNCWYLLNELQMECIKMYGQLFMFVRTEKKKNYKKNVEYNRPKKTSPLLIIVSFSGYGSC